MRDDRPTGTVTLLVTDIEGSTRLIEELGGEEYVRVLAEHRRLLRRAFSAHGGGFERHSCTLPMPGMTHLDSLRLLAKPVKWGVQ